MTSDWLTLSEVISEEEDGGGRRDQNSFLLAFYFPNIVHFFFWYMLWWLYGLRAGDMVEGSSCIDCFVIAGLSLKLL